VEQRTLEQVNSKDRTRENLLRLVNDLIATLLPHTVVADVGWIDIHHPERLLTAAESCFDPMLQTSWVDYVQLLGTLRVVLGLSLKVWAEEPWQSCIKSLLRAFSAWERSCLVEGQESLIVRGVDAELDRTPEVLDNEQQSLCIAGREEMSR
jgi:hypothetical protein